ncbi:MAG: hypothetical protein AMXMBFR16_07450 [Candidatus Uhrbacteria bacterium]
MRQRPYKRREKGYVFDDPLLGYIKGYDRLEAASRNGMELSTEVDSIRHALFPLREVPVVDRPGYVTHERDYFSIECDDPVLKRDLEMYFTDRYSFYRDGLYGHGDSVGDFLEGIAWQLLITGDEFHMIEWEEVDIKNRKYQLPVDFEYLRNETMKVRRKRGLIVGYRQKYSLFTYFKEKRFKDWEEKEKPRSFEFEKDEVIYCQYPFAKKSPTARSLKYLKPIKKFWQFGLDQSRSGVEVESRYFPLERARYTTYASEKRKYDIARGKIRTIFNYLMDTNGPRLTQYYDIYTVIRYKKYLNDFRDYLVREFNEQVLAVVAKKNGFASVPKLVYSGFLANSELDAALQGYKDGTLTFDQIVQQIVKTP